MELAGIDLGLLKRAALNGPVVRDEALDQGPSLKLLKQHVVAASTGRGLSESWAPCHGHLTRFHAETG